MRYLTRLLELGLLSLLVYAYIYGEMPQWLPVDVPPWVPAVLIAGIELLVWYQKNEEAEAIEGRYETRTSKYLQGRAADLRRSRKHSGHPPSLP